MTKPVVNEKDRVAENGASRSQQRVVRALTEWDERVLACITTNKPEGVANWTILPNEYGAGGEISQSLQKLKRRGLAVIVRKHRGVTWWKASQRPNGKVSDER